MDAGGCMGSGPRNFNIVRRISESGALLRRKSRIADDARMTGRRRTPGAALAGIARVLLDGVVSLAYPPRCLGCGDRLFEARMLLCLTCFHAIDRASPEEAEARLQRLPQARAALDDVTCLWIFDKGGALQAVHQALKYGNRPSYGVTLGEPLGAVYHDAADGAEQVDLIVPIPLHRTRLLERGYNQSEMLARGVAAVVGAPVDPKLLVRDRPTKTQTALKRTDRWENLEGAFRVTDGERVRGRRLLIVDDVLTTGSTAGAAAKVLKEAGAASVDLAALALART